MTITVFYSDGTTNVFSDVSEWSLTGDVLAIKGKIDGDTKVHEHRIRWSIVKRIKIEEAP